MYVFYKYFKKQSMWNFLKSLSLDGCRYLTDFGIELISYASNKEDLVNPLKSCGCKKIVKYVNHRVRLDFRNEDLFLSDRFNKSNNSCSIKEDRATTLNTYKVLILNNTEVNFTNFIEKKKLNKEREIINFTQVYLDSKSHSDKLKLNIIETDSVW